MLNRLSEQIHLDTIVEHVSRTYCRPLSKNKKKLIRVARVATQDLF